MRVAIACILTFTVAAVALGCRPDTAPAEAPALRDPTPSEEPAAQDGDAALCARASAMLTAYEPPAGGGFDIDAFRSAMTSDVADGRADLVARASAAGRAAAEIVPDLEAAIAAASGFEVDPLLRALVAIDPARGIEVGAAHLTRDNALLPERYAAASAMAQTGEPGLERLVSIAESTGNTTTGAGAARALSLARVHPIAAREVLFPTGAWCRRHQQESVCQDLLRDLILVWPETLRTNDSGAVLLRAERALALGEAPASTWVAAAEAAMASHAPAVAESLLRVQSMGYGPEAVPIAVRVALSAAVSNQHRRTQTVWILAQGAAVTDVATSVREGIDPTTPEPTRISAALIAIAGDGAAIDDETLEALGAFGAQHRSPISLAALLASARLGAPSPLRAIDPTTLPAGFSELVDAMDEDARTFLAVAVRRDVDAASALDATAFYAAGRRDELRAALMAPELPVGPRTLELAARATAPDPDVADRLTPAAVDAWRSLEVARWLALAAPAVVESVARQGLADPSTGRRRRALQWARVGGVTLEREVLVDAIAAPVVGMEIEHIDARLPALHALLADDGLPLDQAVELLDRVGPNAPGRFEAAALVAWALDACPDPTESPRTRR